MPTFSKKQNEIFRRICKLTENSVFTMMRKLLITSYGRDNVICDDEFIIAKGDIPVALVAHCDTVFTYPPKDIFYDKEANVMWSPQGLGADDRAGIYAIIQILNDELKPHIIITTGEESGCIGSGKIVGKMTNHPFDDLKFMVQLDRRGFKDSVFYQCDNIDFENFVNNFGFETNYGSLSDISVLAPVWGVAAVNFSVGYMDEHSKEERLYVDALFNTIDKVEALLRHVREEKDKIETFKYIPFTSYNTNRCYSNYLDYDDDDYWWNGKNNIKVCEFCSCEPVAEEDLIDIFYDTNKAFSMCTNCYSKFYKEIGWCSKCYRAWYVQDKDERKDAYTNMAWVCPDCRKKVIFKDGKQNQRSNSVLTES